MPQMFPINWLILYMYFLIIFLLFIINIYFFSNLNIKKNKKILLKMNKLDWKW
uniref:ATP synthase F0 subunit 8 n=1 Tax=Nematus trochanteratus TaxID=3029098 RepID=UPI0023D84D56|nr:ATP synthase F0 subunit 8 [Nematus trochanteratus]YP_010718959.1 ATP synthase F0 subunit 8 [Nematus hequensis]WDQ45592.1 ATP synthase F0 subunit 8 [Nematus trochanteratus]WDQ45605.1 ATP synthase F0 subunit 8 [Nematus hequensis]